MNFILSRVSRAAITADGVPRGEIGLGLVVYIGVLAGDTERKADEAAAKIAKLRIFSDERDKLNLSLLDISGQVIIVSNFTLCADLSRGNRPDYTSSAPRGEAERLYEYFVTKMKTCLGADKIITGVFGADMEIDAVMNGPVTITMRV